MLCGTVDHFVEGSISRGSSMSKFAARALASAAAIAVGAVLLSAPAFAVTVVPATQDLGNLNPPDASDFDAAVLGAGTFTVEATFELTTTADTSVSATIAVNRKTMYTPGALELFKNGTAPGDLVSSDPLAFFGTVSPAGAWAAALTEILGPGTYYVEITGTNNVSKLGVGGSVITSNVPRAWDLGDDGAWFRWPRLRGVPPQHEATSGRRSDLTIDDFKKVKRPPRGGLLLIRFGVVATAPAEWARNRHARQVVA